MDSDSTCLWLVFWGIAGYLWWRWYMFFWRYSLQQFGNNAVRWLMQAVPIICTAIILIALTAYGASDVRDDFGYVTLYLGLGILWIGVCELLMRYLGINTPFDVIERTNPSALVALAGAFIGLALCYSGGNIGEGPGIEVVFFSAGLATVGFLVVWWAFITITQADYVVTIDRDLSAGLRLGGFLVAAGLILGRAAAGNWVSAEATISDMILYGSPVLLLLVGAVIVEFSARPTIERPLRSVTWAGLIPMIIYVGVAVAYLSLGKFPA